ncbi:thioesterase family protein [Grosmannia clavigera kw1407]|uniref:Thioesterase family protein n=1 Tax=Grosmannia clavigera (strain kw1407 / UAMH 11150) TaxID=655863 RepID=F0XJ24_GROCL|nr:thioesterase family protein [Grosmannia clavigera kw1407]EFX02156.1 thioesterase family protein [Grosmannia clavigera kw1407]
MLPRAARSAVSATATAPLVRLPLRLGSASSWSHQKPSTASPLPSRPSRSFFSPENQFGSRQYSTASSPPPPSRRRPWIRPSTVVFLLLGAGFGLPLYGFVAQLVPTLPDRGSAAEDKARVVLETRAARLPLVVQLTTDPAWIEWTVGSRWAKDHQPSSTDLETDLASDSPRERLTRDALGGVQGMTGYHRVFLHEQTGELVSVVYLGNALSGFPTRAHGGALATLLDEALGRCAIHTLPARTGVTARLELQYRRPVAVPDFYVVRCRPELPPASSPKASQDLRKLWCSATLETIAGQTCVEARGLFVVPRGYKLGRVEDRF